MDATEQVTSRRAFADFAALIESVGFTKVQSLIYAVLVGLGQSSCTAVSKRTELTRPRCHKVLGVMVEAGFVTRKVVCNSLKTRHIFAPVPIRKIVLNLRKVLAKKITDLTSVQDRYETFFENGTPLFALPPVKMHDCRPSSIVLERDGWRVKRLCTICSRVFTTGCTGTSASTRARLCP